MKDIGQLTDIEPNAANRKTIMVGSPEGATDYIDADARDVDTILRGTAATLDFGQPVAITMLGILPFIGDDAVATGIVRALLAAVPGGQLPGPDPLDQRGQRRTGDRGGPAVESGGADAVHAAHPEQIAVFFDGLQLVEPGLVPCPRWRPDPADAAGARDMDEYCGLGRK